MHMLWIGNGRQRAQKDIMIGCFGYYVQERKKKEEQMSGERLDISDDGLVTGIHPSNVNELLNEQRDTAMKESLTSSKRMIWVTFQKEGIPNIQRH